MMKPLRKTISITTRASMNEALTVDAVTNEAPLLPKIMPSRGSAWIINKHGMQPIAVVTGPASDSKHCTAVKPCSAENAIRVYGIRTRKVQQKSQQQTRLGQPNQTNGLFYLEL